MTLSFDVEDLGGALPADGRFEYDLDAGCVMLDGVPVLRLAPDMRLRPAQQQKNLLVAATFALNRAESILQRRIL